MMESIEIGLWIGEIVAICLSILFGSIIAWRLFGKQWRLEKQERFVSDVLSPLADEVDENVKIIGDDWHRVYDYGKNLMCVEEWERIERLPMWRYFLKDKEKLAELVGRYYDLVSGYDFGIRESHAMFGSMVVGTVGRLLLGVEDVSGEVRDEIKDGTRMLRYRGFSEYIEKGSGGLDDYSSCLDELVGHFCERNDDARKVSGEDLMTVARRRIEGSRGLEMVVEIRSEILEMGELVSKALRNWESIKLDALYKEVL